MGRTDAALSTLSNFHKYHIELIGSTEIEGAEIFRRGFTVQKFHTRLSVWQGREEDGNPMRDAYDSFIYNG